MLISLNPSRVTAGRCFWPRDPAVPWFRVRAEKSATPKLYFRSQFYDLFLDPQVGASEPFFQRYLWSPLQYLSQTCVIRIAAAYSLGTRNAFWSLGHRRYLRSYRQVD